MKEDDNEFPSDLDFELPELNEPEPEPEPLPPPQSQEDLKAALANERFLELSGDEQLELVAADMRVGYRMMDAGLLRDHSGKYIAILRRQFVGADRDLPKLEEEVCWRYGVHPRRIATVLFDDGS